MKEFIILVLFCIIIFLIIQIVSGTFCHCSTIRCQNNNDLKGYIV